jgi:hypothetical protein
MENVLKISFWLLYGNVLGKEWSYLTTSQEAIRVQEDLQF